MNTPQQIIEVVQAFLDGKDVQKRAIGAVVWVDEPSPSWDFIRNEYRPKPMPREGWIPLYCAPFYSSLEQAKATSPNVVFVHVREVIE